MKRRIITEKFMMDDIEYNYQYNNQQQYYIIDETMDSEFSATLRLHCKQRNTNQ